MPAAVFAGGSKGPVVLGEPFSTRVIQDRTRHLPVGVVSMPAKWRFDSRVEWNYQHVELPVKLSYSAANPANEEAMFAYPMEAYYELKPPDRVTPIGQDTPPTGLGVKVTYSLGGKPVEEEFYAVGI